MFGGLGAKAPKTSERETNPLKVGRRVLKEKWDASLSELYSNKFQIKSVSKATLSRPDVLIDVVMGGGIGGVSRGAVRKHGKYHVITALVVDSDPSAEQTHAPSIPHIPTATACYNLSNTEEPLELLYRHVPKALMCKTYIHSSNSCNHASTGNIPKRDSNKTASHPACDCQRSGAQRESAAAHKERAQRRT